MQNQISELDFSDQRIYAGIDVHLKSWTITVRTNGQVFKTFTQPPKPEKLAGYLQKHFPGGKYISAYEAGFSGYWAHRALIKHGIENIILHAADIPTSDKEKRQKEDPRDSGKIARELEHGTMEGIYVPSEQTLADRSLLRTRQILVKDLTRNKNRVKSVLRFYGVEFPQEFTSSGTHWSKRFIRWLSGLDVLEPSAKQALDVLMDSCIHIRKQLLEVNGRIKQLSQTDRYKEQMDLLFSVPGIGLITGMQLLTELEDITRFKNFDQLCSYIGIIPSTRSSGSKEIITDVTPRGHRVLRGALIESAWVVIRHDPVMMHKYNRLIKRMNGNKAILLITKKLLNRIVHILRKQEPYEISVVK